MNIALYQVLLVIGFLANVQSFDLLNAILEADNYRAKAWETMKNAYGMAPLAGEIAKGVIQQQVISPAQQQLNDLMAGFKNALIEEVSTAKVRIYRKDPKKLLDTHPVLPSATVSTEYAKSIFDVGFDTWVTIQESDYKPIMKAEELFENQNYNSSLNTLFLLHDECESATSRSVLKVIEALKMRNYDVNYNILMLDFDKLHCDISIKTGIFKFGIAPQLELLSIMVVGVILKGMQNQKIQPEQINLVGLGMGSQLGGMVAQQIKKVVGLKLNSILGLDPPVNLQKSLFDKDSVNNIHLYYTFKLIPGTDVTTGQGTADFVFGGAKRTSKCEMSVTTTCFKEIGVQVLVATILYPQIFPGRFCHDYDRFSSHMCDTRHYRYVTFPPDNSAIGTYQMDITTEFPFGKGLDGIYEKETEKKGESKEGKPQPTTKPVVKPPPKFPGEEEGPEKINPAQNFWTSDIKESVKLRRNRENQFANRNPISVPGLLHRAATRWPDQKALQFKVNNEWRNITYSEYEENVRTTAKAFLKLGLNRHHGVGIMGFNSPEWLYSDLGAIYAGGVAVGIYTTNSPEECHFILERSKANIVVVEDDEQLQKILKIKNTLPHLKAVIQYSGKPDAPGVMSWQELMELGKQQDDTALEAVLKKIALNECCTLVFTSGTEGKSKAVMLSHDNITWNAYTASRYVELRYNNDGVVSYLPLSHIAAQMVDIYLMMTVGSMTAFADKDAMKGSLVQTLRDIRPTGMLTVPRVWEKLQEQIIANDKSSGLTKMVADWGKEFGVEHGLELSNGRAGFSPRYELYYNLIYRQVKERLGMERMRVAICGGAPISPDLKRFFMSFDIIITDAYGMSECSGPHTISKRNEFKIDAVGKTAPGSETKIDNPDESGHGEICIRGRHVFMGYLGEPEKTEEILDSDGWLHTGDIGYVDSKGFVSITGRKKDLLITAGGENVSPVRIEQVIKYELPCVSHAQVIGDKRKFLTVLLTLKTNTDPVNGVPTDELTEEVRNWFKKEECEVNTLKDVLEGPKKREVMDIIQSGINRANLKAASHAQRVQKFAVLPADFSIATGELGPSMKLKRHVVYEKYADIIESFYKTPQLEGHTAKEH